MQLRTGQSIEMQAAFSCIQSMARAGSFPVGTAADRVWTHPPKEPKWRVCSTQRVKIKKDEAQADGGMMNRAKEGGVVGSSGLRLRD